MDAPKPIVIRPDYSSGQRSLGILLLLGALPFVTLPFALGDSVAEAMLMALIGGGAFGGFGLWIIGRRTGVSVDLVKGELVTVHGLFVARERRRSLDGFQEVTVSRERRTQSSSNGSHAYDVYPVRLASDAETIGLCEHRERQPAMEAAELYARLLHKRMTDLSSGRRIAREVDDLDGSLQDRLREVPPDEHLDEDIEGREAFNALPPKMQAAMEIGVEPVITREGEDLVVEIPPMGLRRQHLGPSMVVFGLFSLPGLLVCYCLPEAACGLVGFGLIAAMLLPFKWSDQISGRQRVRMTPQALLVEARGRKVRLPYDRLQALHIAPMTGPKGHMTLVGGGGIVADAGGELILFGDALPRRGLVELLHTIRGYIADREAVLARLP